MRSLYTLFWLLTPIIGIVGMVKSRQLEGWRRLLMFWSGTIIVTSFIIAIAFFAIWFSYVLLFCWSCSDAVLKAVWGVAFPSMTVFGTICLVAMFIPVLSRLRRASEKRPDIDE
jgi:hypothetical protein